MRSLWGRARRAGLSPADHDGCAAGLSGRTTVRDAGRETVRRPAGAA